MKLQEVFHQDRWDAWAASVEYATFLQSWAWGEGQAALGKRVKRFVFEESGEVVFIAQAVEEKRKFLRYWFVPGGPVQVSRGVGSRQVAKEDWERVMELLRNILLRGRAVFLRLEPLLLLPTTYNLVPSKLIPTASFNPAIRWMVDLRGKTEVQLLEEMEQKTRYNVRLGEKKRVTTRISTEERDFQTFLVLMHDMAKRNGITAHRDGYLCETFFAMAKRGMARLRLAEYDGEALAASIEVMFGDTYTYLHGASSSTQRDIKAPNVLQWEAIKDARARGFHWYDFGGCNPDESSHRLYKPSLEGVTRFKEGWGGGRVECVGTFVMPRFGFLRRFFQ